MRAHTITTTKLALLLSLLALGALGLVACGRGDDDETTAASETETTRDQLAPPLRPIPEASPAGTSGSPPLGVYPLIKVEVVGGDVPCRVARHVLREQYRDVPVTGRTDPGSWFCSGPESEKECENETGETIRAHFAKEATLSPEQRIEQTIDKWAPLFAAAHDRAACGYQTQPLCERIACDRVSTGPIKNCTPPPSEFRQSFADATVQDIAITGGEAGAKLSNGETVELEEVKHIPEPLLEDADRNRWLIHKIGGSAGDVEFITKVGNEWAPLFAKDVSAACRYMYGQPLCEEFFGRVGEPPEVRRPSGFQKSFASATVERVVVRDTSRSSTGRRFDKAEAEFSNGELVEFIQDPHGPPGSLGDWFIDDLGGNWAASSSIASSPRFTRAFVSRRPSPFADRQPQLSSVGWLPVER